MFLFCSLPEKRIKVFYIAGGKDSKEAVYTIQNTIVQFAPIQRHGGFELADCGSLNAPLSGFIAVAGRKLKFMSSSAKVKRLLTCKLFVLRTPSHLTAYPKTVKQRLLCQEKNI